MSAVRVLGLESSCDETSAAIVEGGSVIVSQRTVSQVDTHTKFGGVVPEIASRQHVRVITEVVSEALRDAKMNLWDLDGIAVTCGPGLLGALLVGVSAAKGYALATGLPLYPIHHIAGHVAAVGLCGEWRPPFVCLVVSGGHTELLLVDAEFRFQRLGGTLDDAVGEAYDKVGRLCGLPYPGGPEVDRLAELGNRAKFPFPRPLLEEEGYDFSFSGLKSAVANRWAKANQHGETVQTEDVCASFQAAVLDVLCRKTVAAVRATGLRHVVVAGGVAANLGLRRQLAEAGVEHGFTVQFPDRALCGDNGAMIAAAAARIWQTGRTATQQLNAHASLSLEDWQDHWQTL
jgi:N6-L-threonylcarbamoyladenine synthase